MGTAGQAVECGHLGGGDAVAHVLHGALSARAGLLIKDKDLGGLVARNLAHGLARGCKGVIACACQREDGIERLGRDAHGLVRHVQTDLGQDAHGCIVNAYDLVVAQYADIGLDLIHGLALLFFLSTSLPDFPAADNGICSLFAVILCTFTRVPETGSQTKKNPRGLHFRRGSSRERRFELEI